MTPITPDGGPGLSASDWSEPTLVRPDLRDGADPGAEHRSLLRRPLARAFIAGG